MSASYLDAARRDPSLARIKAAALALLDARAGERALDIGCGTGEDVQAMAPAMAVGVDVLPDRLSQASRRASGSGFFSAGSGSALPFGSSTFDACHVERTLQHVLDPSAVVAEIVRVLRPGGRLVAVEPDWETMCVDSPRAEIGRTLLHHHIQLNRHPTIGRHLRALLLSSGFRDVTVEGRSVIYNSYAVANFFFPLDLAASRAVTAGLVSAFDAQAWIDSLRAGPFFAAVTVFTAYGRLA